MNTNTNDCSTPKLIESLWTPKIGPELKGFLDRQQKSIAEHIALESSKILGGCIQPGQQSTSVGLVVGCVQSGKTASFTAVTALAHDNEFKLIIIIGGTTTLLVNQTTKRLKKDLVLDEPTAFHRWVLCESPKTDNDSGKRLASQVEARAQNKPFSTRGIPIVVVMKHQNHLDNLSECFRKYARSNPDDLAKLSVLIIDDEAHMYGPNVGPDAINTSEIYSKLKALRILFPSHTLLEYTATPQANLLTEIADEFSPNFVRILEPGEGYAGGSVFFKDKINEIIRNVPTEEADALRNPASVTQAPKSLQAALASYLLVCANDTVHDGLAQPRSMLVHSDVQKKVHEMWEHWLVRLKDSWKYLLSDLAPKDDSKILVETIFKPQWDDLKKTMNSDLGALDDLLEGVRQLIDSVMIVTVNSSPKAKDENISYSASPYWILNGGNKLGVGYTVEGLCTTHMVRGPGVGQGDTIQQRGRFFGYRGDEIDRCRVWLERGIKDDFVSYVEHEEQLRTDLSDCERSNLPLRAWKRKFFLASNMQLTRRSAIKLDLTNIKLPDGWIRQNYVDHDLDSEQANRELVQLLCNELVFDSATDISGGTPFTEHQRANGTTDQLRQFLASYIFQGNDRILFERFLLGLSEEELGEHCEFIKIAAGLFPNYRSREVIDGKIPLLQGGNDSYEGDRKAHAGNRMITIQLHAYDLQVNRVKTRSAVPVIALHLPTATKSRLENWTFQKD